MTSPFERLPAEVFDIIAACLDLAEYKSVRLTSQRLHLLTLSTFTKTYFAKLVTTLGAPSLDRLVHVASHRHLSRLVTTLDIRLLTHANYKDLAKIARIGIFPPPKRFPRVSCVRTPDIVRESTLYDDVLGNRHAKCITERLARGLRGLPNLTAICLRAHDTEPPEWKTSAMPEGDQVFRARCLRAVLDAIAQSNTALSSLTLGKESRLALSKCLHAPYSALQLPPASLQRLQPAFAALTHMALSLVSAHTPHHENSLARFLSAAPHLTSLTLSLDRRAHVSHFGARVLRSLSDTTLLERLSSLRILNTTAHESDLSKLLRTHAATLRVLSLANVCLPTGTWPALLSALKRVEGLETLRLSCIEGAGSPVLLRQRGKERRRITLDAAREGQSMAALLDALDAACGAGGGVLSDAA